MNIFYLPEIKEDIVLLDEVESGHAIRVLRMKEGDVVTLTDGSGGWFEGSIVDPHPKKCRIRITSTQLDFEKRNYRLVMAVAPTKNSDRTEWLLEKAVEIGIDGFIPVQCRFSERKNINILRLHKVALAAMKQSLKAYMPDISELVSFAELIKSPFKGKKFIAHCYPGEKPHLKELISAGDDVLVLIGPEGDFSEDEVTLALQNGFREISLGKSRLRTETAALAACHTVALANT
jgi:16S rRNA (uracil1498-N3)-methyltransferase